MILFGVFLTAVIGLVTAHLLLNKPKKIISVATFRFLPTKVTPSNRTMTFSYWWLFLLRLILLGLTVLIFLDDKDIPLVKPLISNITTTPIEHSWTFEKPFELKPRYTQNSSISLNSKKTDSVTSFLLYLPYSDSTKVLTRLWVNNHTSYLWKNFSKNTNLTNTLFRDSIGVFFDTLLTKQEQLEIKQLINSYRSTPGYPIFHTTSKDISDLVISKINSTTITLSSSNIYFNTIKTYQSVSSRAFVSSFEKAIHYFLKLNDKLLPLVEHQETIQTSSFSKSSFLSSYTIFILLWLSIFIGERFLSFFYDI